MIVYLVWKNVETSTRISLSQKLCPLSFWDREILTLAVMRCTMVVKRKFIVKKVQKNGATTASREINCALTRNGHS